ncbi:MAG: hypothetical protein PHI40_08335, partial [Caldisericia bacterium]|nr:hypothetical protein [Caldisericia bacterium]
HTVLWEHTDLFRTKSNTVWKPEIIEKNGMIFANYGNVLNVYQRSSGKKLFAYVPYVGSDPYVILNIEIHEEFLYALIANSKSISCDENPVPYLLKMNISNFDFEWKKPCQCGTMTRYFFAQGDTIYLFNFTWNLTCCFDCYNVETGGYNGGSSSIEIPICITDDEVVLASQPKYNQELNEVWVYYFRSATEENPHSGLEIQRLDLEEGYLLDPILIPMEPSFDISIGMYSFFPMLQHENLLFAEYYDTNKKQYIVMKINLETKLVDWAYESQKEVPEIFLNPVDKNTLYLREGMNAYRKINHSTTDTLKHWEINEVEEEDYVYSQSSCMDHIIATRFVHSVVVFDTKAGEVVWMKESDTPTQFKNVAFIDFTPPIIEKTDQNTYQILYALDDQIGLVEITLQ